MNVLLMPLGSHGDVHPFVGLGLGLRRRGHCVTIITSSYFEPLVRRVGLEFEGIGTPEEFLEGLKDPNAWDPVKGFQFVVERLILASLRRSYDALAKLYVRDETVVVAPAHALGARIAQNKLGVPLVTIHLQPMGFPSVYETPVYPQGILPRWLPPFVKRFLYWWADWRVIDPIVAPTTNAFRAELGLPPVRRLFTGWCNSPQRVLGLFPDWFGPPQPDWPPQTRLVGFPLYDERGVEELPPDLTAFLDSGDPPLVFTPGSAMLHGHAFFGAAVEACGLLGRRGLLLTRHREQVPAVLPAGVRHFDYAPFSEVLPRSAALVYHGGIGTLAQGLAAGVPHLVMPLSHDQPDNAARLRRLGVGRSLLPRDFKGSAVARELDALLTSAEVAERCREVARRFEGTTPLEDACREVEALAEQTVATAGAARLPS